MNTLNTVRKWLQLCVFCIYNISDIVNVYPYNLLTTITFNVLKPRPTSISLSHHASNRKGNSFQPFIVAHLNHTSIPKFITPLLLSIKHVSKCMRFTVDVSWPLTLSFLNAQYGLKRAPCIVHSVKLYVHGLAGSARDADAVEPKRWRRHWK